MQSAWRALEPLPPATTPPRPSQPPSVMTFSYSSLSPGAAGKLSLSKPQRLGGGLHRGPVEPECRPFPLPVGATPWRGARAWGGSGQPGGGGAGWRQGRAEGGGEGCESFPASVEQAAPRPPPSFLCCPGSLICPKLAHRSLSTEIPFTCAFETERAVHSSTRKESKLISLCHLLHT